MATAINRVIGIVPADIIKHARPPVPDIGPFQYVSGEAEYLRLTQRLDKEPNKWALPRQFSNAYVLPEAVGGPLEPPPPLPDGELPAPILNPALPDIVLPGGGPDLFPSNMEF